MDQYRKQLLYKATHRGMKETDQLLGGFARSWLDTCPNDSLHSFDSLLDEADHDLLKWILGQEEVPPYINQDLMSKIIDFNENQVRGSKT